MRKNLKTQCLETIDVLGEAHKEIANYIGKHQTDEAVSLLEQCQQGAISVGTTIDEAEGEGTEEVRELEQYCELAYQFHEELLRGASVNARQMIKKLQKPLIRVSNGIRNRIPSQREVVFLPYKASMWDSLETVWKKLDAEPDCEAVVVPIPYYDKNPDGTFREMHYEIDLFPKDVPVRDYRTYDIAGRHPEAIYIHNPYDDGNYVTSVHPDYYSSKLKDYTEELVYIPYFVLGEIDPDDKEAVEGVEHFCTVAGVVNAHRVIVQSEAMKRVYVNVLTKYAGEETRAYWEKKIEGTGSPKVERVLALKPEDFELPEDWKRITERADGSRKKVIFYNTSVGALLQESDRMLEKIARSFEVFRENRDEVALLWRPHPLIEATLTSMRPELWEEYSHIVREYRDAGWGIYDDTADMDRAIAISDGYYGDWSSIVWLYQKTGKPIMIQNVEA